MNRLKTDVMAKQGYQPNPADPDNVKYEVAEDKGIPLKQGYNGNLTSKQAGTVGGEIGGNMVKEMIQMAEKQLQQKQ